MSGVAAQLEDLRDAVRRARAGAAPLAIVGGGTKAFYGGPLTGTRLETRGLSGISAYEPSELVVTALAGTPLAEVEAALAAHDQCLPFDPPRFAPGGTIGGMVASGLAGPGRLRHGGVRDYVLGCTLINGRAELLSFGGQVMKNVAGYDVSRLVVGSLGVLGVLCELSLKVVPRPQDTVTLAFALAEVPALSFLAGLAREPLPVEASAWHAGVATVRLAGNRAAVAEAVARLGGEALAPHEATAHWNALRDQSHPLFTSSTGDLWRFALPPTAPALGLAGESLVDWGGALRWWRGEHPAADVQRLARALGGHATLYRPSVPAAAPFAPLEEPMRELNRRLKLAFDPDRVFNRHRLSPDY